MIHAIERFAFRFPEATLAAVVTVAVALRLLGRALSSISDDE